MGAVGRILEFGYSSNARRSGGNRYASVYIRTRMDANGVPVSEEATNVIFMGPEGHGYVRTMGLGPTPSQVFGKASTSQTPIDESIISSKLESLVKEKMESLVADASSMLNLNTTSNGYMFLIRQMALQKMCFVR
ncbi:hypothetical protein M9H77_31194 [Catharanthus roseus]|uniref:Uncharacterized protein n=1 Tax=Catharanthus roseus TaxID=4058 RepID=A0ACC0A0N5_CATRO|nr:hypothetical protein M9H77_31194 [Catharanthus roseus]